MMQPHIAQAASFLRPYKDEIKSILNIGMNCDPGKLNQKDLIEIIWEDFGLDVKTLNVQVIEAYQPYIDFGPTKYPNMKFIHGDVREVWTLADPADLVVWWRGPEHIPEQDLEPTIANLESLANRFVLLGSPDGWHPQGPDGLNHWDSHVSGPDVALYERLGYATLAVMDPVFLSAIAFKEIK